MNPGKRRPGRHFYEFGSFRLDPLERTFARNGQRIPLAPKAFDTLLILVQHSGQVLTKQELIKTLWPDSFVEENNLTQQISALRKALANGNSHPLASSGQAQSELSESNGGTPAEIGGQEYIETVPKLGYRFVCEVRESGDGLDSAGAERTEVVASERTHTQILLGEETQEAEEEEVSDGLVPTDSPATVRQARGGHFEHSQSWGNRATAASWDKPKGASMSKLNWAWLAIAAMLLAAAGITAWFEFWNRASSSSPTGNFVRLTFDSGLTMSPALSPDGRLVAYASDRGGKGNLDIWVQPVSGGEALRLTHDSTDNSAPTFSADGQTIAFRSEREPRGIYLVSVHGGEARLVAPNGRRPRLSPDGNWIAYWVGSETEDNTGAFMVPGAGKIYIVPASGGRPREIRSEFAAAGYPIWAPDSEHILFLGNRDPNIYHEGTTDWWVTSIDGSDVVSTGARTVFRSMGFASGSQVPGIWASDGTGVLMSASFADTRNIWRVPISMNDWKVSAPPQRLTSGTSADMQPSMAGNELVFASLSGKLDVWSLPIDADRVERNGDIQRLTDDAFGHGYPAISSDGTRLAFSLQRSGGRDVWVKDLISGTERAVSIPPGPSFNPNFSPDGNTLVYRAAEDRTSVGYAFSLVAGGTKEICTDCSDYGWSSDQTKLVLVGTSPARISILEVATNRRTPLLDDPAFLLWNPRFSPDDRWISFSATEQGKSRVFVAPVRERGIIPKEEWIAVTDSGDKPRWSPDGNTLYFVSDRDGFRCIWAQSLDDQKRPRGAAIPVFHAHEGGRSLSSVGPGDLSISVGRDKIVFNMNERTGNLWLTNLNGRR